MRRLAVLAAAAATIGALVAPGARAGGAQGRARTYLVLYRHGVSLSAAHRAIRRAGARIVGENRDIGLALVRSSRGDFTTRAGRASALKGVARNRAIGRAPADKFAIERSRGRLGASRRLPPAPAGDPLSGYQWDMQMIHATPQGSYRYLQGSHAVRVGIIDTGIDGHHPDIAPNFDWRLSRNFTVDDPVIDGPCDQDIDGSCAADPADVDENEHGTHVAGTVAAALNGLGIAGVAPRADLVNLRAGQDSGYFFLLPTVDALTYAGDHGIDVVNMSFYVDPWLYNCAHNPADSPAEQREQQTVIGATERAMDYAYRHGVTMVVAEGNENTDIGHPTSDDTSPDYPNQDTSPHHRDVDNSCLSMPSEGPHAINVSAIGPTQRKAYYSNYGVEQTDVAAPGGDRREFFGTPEYNQPQNRILAPFPENVGRADGRIDANGNPTDPLVMKDCTGGTCAYWQWLQGTSMAAPHATGVAALIVARYGHRDRRHGGLTLNPARTERLLEATARPHACPAQNPFHYPDPDLGPEYDALCEGTTQFNGFYGHGIVDALAAIRGAWR